MAQMFEFRARIFLDEILSRSDGFFRKIIFLITRNSDFEVFDFGDGVFDFDFQRAVAFAFDGDFGALRMDSPTISTLATDPDDG